jgi:hypothetical protein
LHSLKQIIIKNSAWESISCHDIDPFIKYTLVTTEPLGHKVNKVTVIAGINICSPVKCIYKDKHNVNFTVLAVKKNEWKRVGTVHLYLPDYRKTWWIVPYK